MANSPDDLIDYRAGHTPRYWSHQPKKVALVGMGPSVTDLMTERLTQEAAPDFADEIWVINMSSMMLWHDLVFWMDDLHDQEAFRPGLMAELRRHGKPVITAKSYPDIVPNSYDYPLEPIVQMSIQIFDKPYLNNSVAQAVAYAIYKDVKVLKLYGCDFTYPNREIAESGRACAEAWLTVANLKGINLAVAPKTSLFDACDDKLIYGYKGPLSIDLGNGDKYEYMTQKEAEKRQIEGYVPEDSSGKPPQNVEEQNAKLSGSLPGTPSVGTNGNGRGESADEHGDAQVEAEPVGLSGDGLRHPDQSGSAQGSDPSDDGGRGTAWDLPQSSRTPGFAANGAQGPGHQGPGAGTAPNRPETREGR